jgi:hypothetical protein
MKLRNGFAMFDVLLAVILMAIAAVGSYSLVKSFKSSSSVQQVTQYANTITQNFMPFLEGVSYDSVLDPAGTHKLSNDFLLSIGIPSEDLEPNEACADSSVETYCTVNTGLHTSAGESLMQFAQSQDASGTNVGADYFIVGLKATVKQANSLAQNLGTTYSVFCGTGKLSGATPCGLDAGGATDTTSVFMVFPKSGKSPPSSDFTVT